MRDQLPSIQATGFPRIFVYSRLSRSLYLLIYLFICHFAVWYLFGSLLEEKYIVNDKSC